MRPPFPSSKKSVSLFLIAEKQSEEALPYRNAQAKGLRAKRDALRTSQTLNQSARGLYFTGTALAKRLDFIGSLINLCFLGGFL